MLCTGKSKDETKAALSEIIEVLNERVGDAVYSRRTGSSSSRSKRKPARANRSFRPPLPTLSTSSN